MRNQFDIIVLGGGISGLGVAREAARGGFEVLLLEKGRCVSAASAGSLRIIHGGFRYLQNLDIGRVIHSLKAQQELLREYPDFIKPLPCMMPLERWGLKSRLPAAAGHLLYSTLHKCQSGEWNEGGVRPASFAARHVPLLEGMAPHGVLNWQDALLVRQDDFHWALQNEISRLGGVIKEETEVKGLETDGGAFRVCCSRGEEQEIFTAKVVVNCLGAWINTVARTGIADFVRTRWCKAFNIVLKRQLENKFAVGIKSREGRLFFVAPRGSCSAIGTWYMSYDGDPDEMRVSEQDLEIFMEAFNRVLPAAGVSRSDVLSVEAGVLPMSREGKAGPELYGMSRIYQRAGYIEILSTKYTTGIIQGREVMLRLAGYLKN